MVLDYGKTLTSGTPESVRRDPAVIAARLGGSAMSDLLTVNRPQRATTAASRRYATSHSALKRASRRR